MTYNTREIAEFSLPLPLTQAARMIAQEFAAQQPTPQKVEQVRLNTLAVCVVNYYLQMMGIPTDVTAGDSWNPVVRLCDNVADLEVIGVGRLECRPLRADEQICYVPPEVWEDRIGYVVVQLNEPLQEATVLGFTQTAAIEQLPISQLQPLENLLAHLHQLMHPLAGAIPLQKAGVCLNELPFVATPLTPVHLNQWLQGIFAPGWQTIEALLGSAQSSLAFRRAGSSGEPDVNNVKRAKLIDLGMQVAGYPIALLVELKQESEQKIGILLQVHPTGSQTYLPPRLQLIVLDEAGTTFLEAQARSADNYIQLQFRGRPGEQFSVKVALGDVSLTENFVV